MAENGTSGFRYKVTGYGGFEDQILRLRNENRPIPQSVAFLRWRYTRPADAPEPRIIWITDDTDRPLGMAALIFRPFWINGESKYVAVVGDISLDARLRGMGLGRSLFQFLTDYLQQHHSDGLAFVIPTEQAARILSSIGWRTEGRLVPYVLVLDPTERLVRFLGPRLASVFAAPYREILRAWLRIRVKRGDTLRVSRAFDDTFGAFWKDFPKEGLALHDLGIESLTWRYAGHPNQEFRFARLERDEQLAGYLVFALADGGKLCLVYDLIVNDPADLRSLIALFVGHCHSAKSISTIRLLLNDVHPYRDHLSALCFVRRAAQGVFQVHASRGHRQESGLRWSVTLADKDI